MTMLGRREFLTLGALLTPRPAGARGRRRERTAPVLRAEDFKHHVDFFNAMVDEGVAQHIPNTQAWEWLASNIPLFECPDPVFEQTWYYRWWSYRKHIRQTPRGQGVVSSRDYFDALRIYTYSHRLRLEDGRLIPWVDENLNPFTGDWLARMIKIRKGRFDGGGDHYNHSTYCDLITTGLVGLRPRADDWVEVRPLLPPQTWDWFCLDRVKYHGRLLTILWDRTGQKYGREKGLRVFCDGKEVCSSSGLEPVRTRLPAH